MHHHQHCPWDAEIDARCFMKAVESRRLIESVAPVVESRLWKLVWTIRGAWVLKPRNSKPRSVVHFVGGIFVGAAPQLTYRLFLEGLSEKGVLVIATPYASGFDHFFIADDVQLKFDRYKIFPLLGLDILWDLSSTF
ncbi:Gut esterase [Actinidia rufa]|uniref:Gut esterase n=1 Tax=Actinidia rufa TaxID=165716 RepID=A0A7J0EPE6_9ERIC|nr:Gut esterase [Actinidia rufa]